MTKLLYRCILALGVVLVALASACTSSESVMQSYPLDGMDGVIDQDHAAFDAAVSADGKGSIKITTDKPVTVRLLETGDLAVEDARVLYEAKVKSDDLAGKAYLEMWCRMPDKGEFFSRGLDRPIMGPADWTTLSTPFFLKKGEDPENILLNLVIEGKGTVWIDDIKLKSGPLK